MADAATTTNIPTSFVPLALSAGKHGSMGIVSGCGTLLRPATWVA
jgi:hypothetical protein